MRLLIAEDDETTRVVVAGSVQKWGYEPVAVDNGAAAWAILQDADAPSLLLIDWNMPEMDGVDVVRAIRTLDAPLPPYVIMLTSRSDERDIVQALDAGANDYVRKPYSADELRARLDVGRRVLQLQKSLADKVDELQKAMNEVKTLSGLIPICAGCKKIRDDQGFWQQVETYVRERTGVQFTHGFCPDCMKKWMGE